jgi:hypothetical protein
MEPRAWIIYKIFNNLASAVGSWTVLLKLSFYSKVHWHSTQLLGLSSPNSGGDIGLGVRG